MERDTKPPSGRAVETAATTARSPPSRTGDGALASHHHHSRTELRSRDGPDAWTDAQPPKGGFVQLLLRLEPPGLDLASSTILSRVMDRPSLSHRLPCCRLSTHEPGASRSFGPASVLSFGNRGVAGPQDDKRVGGAAPRIVRSDVVDGQKRASRYASTRTSWPGVRPRETSKRTIPSNMEMPAPTPWSGRAEVRAKSARGPAQPTS
jgi:hypothetical protein